MNWGPFARLVLIAFPIWCVFTALRYSFGWTWPPGGEAFTILSFVFCPIYLIGAAMIFLHWRGVR